MLHDFEDIEILAREEYTHDTNRYWLSYLNDENKEFEAGQFITFDLPISDKKNKRWRSYSIANMPNNQNVYELVIKLFKDGDGGSRYIFENWFKDAVVRARPPQGNFTLVPSDEKTSFLFLCTGVGVAPFRSMIYELINKRPEQFDRIDLVFGAKQKKDLLYFDEFTNLSLENPKFNYYCRLSQENFQGKTKAWITKEYPALLNKNPQLNQEIYICGWREMIDNVRKDLTEKGVEKKNIHYELYG